MRYAKPSLDLSTGTCSFLYKNFSFEVIFVHIGIACHRRIYSNVSMNKIASKLKFLYGVKKFLSKELRKILCNALLQPHLTTCVRPVIQISIRNKEPNYRFYKTKVNVSAYNLTTQSLSEMKILTK